MWFVDVPTRDELALFAESVAPREVLRREHVTHVARDAEMVERRRSQSRVASDVAELAKAAAHSAVDALLIADGYRVAGSIDSGTGVLTLDTDGDAVDDLCRLVLRSAGGVVVLEPDALPEGGPVVAVLRFAG